MSKWVEMRDSIVQTLKVDEVTEELKVKVTQSIIDNVFPAIGPGGTGIYCKDSPDEIPC